jgi:hypothetical protein
MADKHARVQWLAYSDKGGRLAYWQWCRALDCVRALEALGLDCISLRVQLGCRSSRKS